MTSGAVDAAVYKRVMTAAEADALVGSAVPALMPNVTRATVARDDTGRPLFAYLPCDGVAELRRAVMQLDWSETFRANTGSRNKSRTFGYRPRKPYMPGGESCARSGLARDDPAAHQVLEGWSSRLGNALREVLPEVAELDEMTAAAVLPDWRFGLSEPWTSGVVNRTSTLPYHRDGFNFPVWSAMPVVRRAVQGGHLAIPEYDVTIECRDGWALFFPGYELVHGVTPMRTTRPDGYRISVVYYSLRGLKDCFTAAQETAYGRRRRSQREQDMATRIARGETGIPGHPSSRPARTEPIVKSGAELTADLIEFARLEVEAADIEPWAAILADLRRVGDLDDEQAAWALKLYNAYDDFGSAFRVFERAPSPRAWVHDEGDVRELAASLPLSGERRSLRGGRVLKHLDDYAAHLDGRPQLEWLRDGIPAGPDASAVGAWAPAMRHMRKVWGVGRQTAFEWAEFAGKVLGLPLEAPDACLWESTGPRAALQMMYERDDPTAADLDEWAAETKETLRRAGVDLAWWDFETVICDFKVMVKGRYYPGQHIAMIREEIEGLPEPWRGRLRAALRRIVPEPWSSIPPGVDKGLRPRYRDTGVIVTPFRREAS